MPASDSRAVDVVVSKSGLQVDKFDEMATALKRWVTVTPFRLRCPLIQCRYQSVYPSPFAHATLMRLTIANT